MEASKNMARKFSCGKNPLRRKPASLHFSGLQGAIAYSGLEIEKITVTNTTEMLIFESNLTNDSETLALKAAAVQRQKAKKVAKC